MSISLKAANLHRNAPAVLCCRAPKGAVIGAVHLEDPSVFTELEGSGLLSIPAGALTIGQVLGATLKETADALTPLTAALVEDLPGSAACCAAPLEPAAPPGRVVRTLTHRNYDVSRVEISGVTSFEDGQLTVRESLCRESLKADPLVKKVEMDVITPDRRHVFSNTIMDVIPVATKVEGKLGEGVTHVMDGVVFILTGVDEAGIQLHEFGSCEGCLDEKISFGRPGCPDSGDLMVRVNVVIQAGTGMERRGPYAAHRACDAIMQEVREALKRAPTSGCMGVKTYSDMKRPGRPRVVLVKEIMGQGAMHEKLLLPAEPAGVEGGRRNVDLGNVPVVLSPNEVRDGGIHALTCVGPATKEGTRHYFREPLLRLMAEDEEIGLVGVVFIGSPQVNDEKAFVSARLGALVEALDVDGAIVTTEGFGNNHIDFADSIEQIGARGVSVVGVSFSAYQGQLVVGNRYMDAMIELNKHPEGRESEILGESTLCLEDAQRALLMLKTKMAGIPIAPADRRWTQSVIDANQRLVK
ncbi:D-proline reductase (dithiol) proprotein PrdA [Sorangium cellulosum]|uniref:D-proline reductase (Dithiol) proprotein PrdA n=1 Tax=Sorangium cellulosum TaxID=56 RepID=A0A150P904_SORCE|nr:D-proline reductase (dithiol) proprotein PrdA [Sorangium cellulosum]KYF52081.1 D-proline reductase (dithiol) proprotein PrdA [Sorangium cellulosum]